MTKNKNASAGTVSLYAVAFCCVPAELVLDGAGGTCGVLYGPRPARCECRPRHEADAGSRNPYRMPEGPQCQYNTSSDAIQQKATAYDHTVPAAAFLFFLPSTAFFVDKGPACYYNNVVKMALLCGFAAVQNK